MVLVGHIAIGNGIGLPITHTGSSSLKTPFHSFSLKNVLHVPTMTTNLISVNQFCRDNNCSFTFTDFDFIVKDNQMGRILLQGLSKDGFYSLQIKSLRSLLRHHIPNKIASLTALFSNRASCNTWHLHLSHPNKKTFHHMISSQALPIIGVTKFSTTCPACQMGKSSRSPF